MLKNEKKNIKNFNNNVSELITGIKIQVYITLKKKFRYIDFNIFNIYARINK